MSEENNKQYITKDSGERIEWESGFRRDTNKGKPRYDLIPHECLKELAELYSRGAEKYGSENWKKAETEEEINRFIESAFRHFYQFIAGEDDESHMAATVFNLFAYRYLTIYKKKNV